MVTASLRAPLERSSYFALILRFSYTLHCSLHRAGSQRSSQGLQTTSRLQLHAKLYVQACKILKFDLAPRLPRKSGVAFKMVAGEPMEATMAFGQTAIYAPHKGLIAQWWHE